MHQHHDDFITAIAERKLVVLVFTSKDDGGAQVLRTCAPMDFGPSSRALDKSDRYHLWDYDSDGGPHTLSLLPEQVVSIVSASDTFDPGEFVSWDPAWHHPRDWGGYS